MLVDGSAFQQPHGGIARLWRAVLAEWAENGFAEHVTILDRGGTAPRLPGYRYCPAPLLRAPDSGVERSLLQSACDALAADLFVPSEYTCPTRTPSFLYVYDMTPEVLGFDLGAPQWREKRHALEHAAAFACLSESTLRDLRRVVPTARAKRAVVALPGVGPEFSPPSPEAVRGIVATLGLPQTYVIFLGHRDGYKNATLLFDALELLQDRTGLGVLLVGGAPMLEAEYAKRAGRIPVTIARLTDDELRGAYAGAAALVYPSRYEGFGLPVVEAMACGCPVITCRNSSLPEAADDAAIFVGEDAPRELAAAIDDVRRPEVREQLVSRGRAWSHTFEWSRTGRVLQEAILEAAESARGRSA